MRSQVGFAQSLSRAYRQCGNRIGCHAEHWRNVSRRQFLYFGEPQDRLPALGQGLEREDGKGGFMAFHRLVRVRIAWQEVLDVFDGNLL
ncbi:hypothetical protein M2368_002668 [Arthrobacter sp. JUb119]|nr:hypothetical protein [Arthrobacter sp. JUb119]